MDMDMLNGTISPKTYGLLNQFVAHLPALGKPLQPESGDSPAEYLIGLEHLKLILEKSDYLTAGIWERSGQACYIRGLTEPLTGLERAWVEEVVLEYFDHWPHGQGYFCIHERPGESGEEDDVETFVFAYCLQEELDSLKNNA